MAQVKGKVFARARSREAQLKAKFAKTGQSRHLINAKKASVMQDAYHEGCSVAALDPYNEAYAKNAARTNYRYWWRHGVEYGRVVEAGRR